MQSFNFCQSCSVQPFNFCNFLNFLFPNPGGQSRRPHFPPIHQLDPDSKKGYFAALRSTRGYRGGHQRLHLPPQNATNPPIAGPLVTPLCLEAGGGAAILPTSCLEKEGYRFAVFVGASLAREIAWAFARLTFDPPPTGTKPGDGLGEGYCHPYAASGAGEEASQDSSSNLRGTRSRTRVNAVRQRRDRVSTMAISCASQLDSYATPPTPCDMLNLG